MAADSITGITGQASCDWQLIETEMDERRLIDRTCKPILAAGFFLTFLSCTAISITANPTLTVGARLWLGMTSGLGVSIVLLIPLFISWGVSAYLGGRLNSILGEPLNPSAVAALAAGIAFGVAHTIASAAFTSVLFAANSSLHGASPTTCAIIGVFGSLVFQTVARVRIKRDIARHNARAGRKLYTESPCDVRFKIQQMMIVTVVVSVLLAITMRMANANLVIFATLWGVFTAAAFYPAIVAANWFDQKLGSVKLKSWEEPRRCDSDFESETSASQPVDQSDPATLRPVVDVAVNTNDKYLEPMPNYRSAARFTSSDVMSSAVNWIGFAGAAFGLLLTVALEACSAINGEQVIVGGMILVIPTVFAGLIAAFMLSGFAMLILTMVNFSIGEPMRMGTMAAFAGGLVGSFGAWMLLGAFRLVHFVPYNGALDFSTTNNLFPLAMILLAALMGQTLGRFGVKKCGYRNGLTQDEYQSQSTGPVLSRFTPIVLILSACASIMVVAQNEGAKIQGMDYIVMGVLGAFACTMLVWPVANFLAHAVSVAPKSSPKRGFSLAVLRQPQA